jgi:uncharacterized Zn-finger protein
MKAHKKYISMVGYPPDNPLDVKILSMMESVKGVWICKPCGKTHKYKHNIKDHIESLHIEDMCHPCEQCGKAFKTRQQVRRHILQSHAPPLKTIVNNL